MMDIERIQKICDDYLDYYRSPEYHENNDWESYIFEVTLSSVFGMDIFEKLDAVDKQKEIARKQKVIDKLQAELDTESGETA